VMWLARAVCVAAALLLYIAVSSVDFERAMACLWATRTSLHASRSMRDVYIQLLT
jgi:YbbR domain-containing protein